VEEEAQIDEAGRKELAKNLVTYADAITAFAFVQSVAFGFALGQKEFRESVLRGWYLVVLFLLIAYYVYFLFVRKCRLNMGRLNPLTKPPLGDAILTECQENLWKYRYTVLALSLVLSLVALGSTLLGACREQGCPPKHGLVSSGGPVVGDVALSY
jgi:hypothetical protein